MSWFLKVVLVSYWGEVQPLPTAQGALRASITAEVKYGKSTTNVTVGSKNLPVLHFNSAFTQLDFIRRFDWSILEYIIISRDTNATPFVALLAPDSRSYFTFDVQVGHELLKCTYGHFALGFILILHQSGYS